MTTSPTRYGFDASTNVSTVRMLLKGRGAEFDQFPVNVLTGVAADHLFPDFVGGKNEEMRQDCIEKSHWC